MSVPDQSKGITHNSFLNILLCSQVQEGVPTSYSLFLGFGKPRNPDAAVFQPFYSPGLRPPAVLGPKAFLQAAVCALEPLWAFAHLVSACGKGTAGKGVRREEVFRQVAVIPKPIRDSPVKDHHHG